MMEQVEKLYVVDVMAMAFRNYHAFGRRPLQTSQGFPTSAIFGSAVYIMKLLEEEKPDYLIFATDTAEKTFRHGLYQKYKANRSDMPTDLAIQIPEVYRLIEAWGFPLLKQGGFEADDLIGSLVHKYACPSRHCYIVSGDKDFMQLVSDEIFLYQPRKGATNERITKAEVCQRFTCDPKQVIDILALWGDASDNVPGVPGVGEKGASKLIAQFGSLDGIYARLEELSNPRLRENLAKHKEQAYLSQQLVTIKTDVHLAADLVAERLDYRQALAREQLLQFFRDMEFSSLSQRVRRYQDELGSLRSSPRAAGEDLSDRELLKLGTPARQTEPAAVEDVVVAKEPRFYHLVQTPAQLAALVASLTAAETFAFDTETTGLDVTSDLPIGVSFAITPYTAYYVPLLNNHLRGLERPEVLAALRQIFANENACKVAHNIKFDLQMLGNAGISVKGPLGDTMLAAFVLDASVPGFGLDALSKRELNVSKIPTHSLIGKKGEVAMADVPLDRLLEYACEDVDCCLRLHELYTTRLRSEEGLFALYQDLELPLAPILGAMEQKGIYVDGEILADISEKLLDEMQRLEKTIYELAGEEFNINSPKQLATILYEKLAIPEKLGIKRIKKTKSGYSTDVSVLESLVAHPLPAQILAYRSVAKLKNTYVDTLPQLISEKTGRIHTSFHQTGTATGRLSSSGPNLQNIPIRSAQGREIRAAFASDQDWLTVSADYSQIELRILAHMAQEDNLIAAFHSGQDIHTATAATMFKKEPAEVSANDRSKAKAINYGIIYGMGPQRLARSTGASLKEAKDFIDRYFETFPKIRDFIAQAVAAAEKCGYSVTITGRRRRIAGINGDEGPLAKVNARNMAVNSPIQGSAADLMKLAMLKVAKLLKEAQLSANMLLQVHDELVFECPRHEETALRSIIKQGMEGAMSLAVPLNVDIGSGRNWLEAH